MADFYATLDFSAKFSRMELHKQRQISYQPNATAMIFKRICYADITNYPIKFFSTGTLFTNVIKIIDQRDRLLRNPRYCSKVFQESSALQQQQISHNVLQKHWIWTKYRFQSNPKTNYTLAHNFKASKSKLLLWSHAVAARGEIGREGCEISSLVEHMGLSSWPFL